jgi:hypothetical protein
MKRSPLSTNGKSPSSHRGLSVQKGLLWEYMLPTTIARALTYSHLSWHSVTDLQGPPSGRTQSDKIRDLKSLAKQYARDRGSCDDTRISYLEYVESEAEADWTLARMIAG